MNTIMLQVFQTQWEVAVLTIYQYAINMLTSNPSINLVVVREGDNGQSLPNSIEQVPLVITR